jgi:D-glycero-D-manno-heptose 1,7-bisphosphate phosphatase
MDPALRAAVFLDRDGTVIHDVGYPRDPALVRLMPGAAAALVELQRRGFALVVVSNQSGIGRGLITEEEARQVHERFVALLAEHGIRLDAVCYCPHTPEAGCACRKPAPGMLVHAADTLGIDLVRSFLVGDKASDIEAGRRAGCRTVLLTVGEEEDETTPDAVASNWLEVMRHILGP